jgi:hypothetical protein
MLAHSSETAVQGEPLTSLDITSFGIIRYDDPQGPLQIWLEHTANGSVFTLAHPGELLVEVDPQMKMAAKCRPGLPEYTLQHFIRDQVMPRVLAHQGNFVIHAAGVRLGDEAILLMGGSGFGKSTLSTSFDQAGFALLGDDAMIIEALQTPTAQAVYPSLRLMPDSIAALFPQPVPSSPIAHYSAKLRIDLPDAEGSAPLPIRALFQIAAQSTPDISLRPLRARETCINLVESSFALDPADTELAAERLKVAGDLANSLPAFEIAYPRNYARLPDVRAAILSAIPGYDGA